MEYLNANYKNIFSLEGKKVVVTGGCGYLGKEIVKGLSDFGANIVVIDYKIVEDKHISSDIKYIQCNLDDTNCIKKSLKEELTLSDLNDNNAYTVYYLNEATGNLDRIGGVGDTNYASGAINSTSTKKYTLEDVGDYYIHVTNASNLNSNYYWGDNENPLYITTNFGYDESKIAVKLKENQFLLKVYDKTGVIPNLPVTINSELYKTDERGMIIFEDEIKKDEKTKISLDDLDKINELFLRTKDEYDLVKQRKIIRNISFIYLLEVKENIDKIDIERLKISYFADNIKSIVLSINALCELGFIKKDLIIDLNTDLSVDSVLEIIKRIEFNEFNKGKVKEMLKLKV